jgi:hypothetical protein
MTGVALLFVLGFAAVLGGVVLAMRVLTTPRAGRIRQEAAGIFALVAGIKLLARRTNGRRA